MSRLGYSGGIRDFPVVHAVVQARLNATRLPNKMLLDLGGKPVLQHAIDRLKKCKTLHNIIVASPDKELVDFAYSKGIWGYPSTGDENNVLLRYIKAASWAGSTLVVRITGDCPLIDPEMVDNCVSEYVNSRVDIVTNVFRRTYPKGFDCEVLHINTLKRIYHLTADHRYREHVTLFAYENPSLFVFKSIFQNKDYSWINLSIDDQFDIDKMRLLVSQGYDGSWNIERITKWYESFERGRLNECIPVPYGTRPIPRSNCSDHGDYAETNE